jgi:hypothetical protein
VLATGARHGGRGYERYGRRLKMALFFCTPTNFTNFTNFVISLLMNYYEEEEEEKPVSPLLVPKSW